MKSEIVSISHDGPMRSEGTVDGDDKAEPVPDYIDRWDIGRFYKKVDSLNQEERKELLEKIWKPTQNGPYKSYSGKKRRFLVTWLEKYPWMCYSELLDGVFCLNCLLFCKKDEQLVRRPCKDWKNGVIRFDSHQISASHKASVQDTLNFKAVTTNKAKSVYYQMNTAHLARVKKNREVLRAIIKVLVCLA